MLPVTIGLEAEDDLREIADWYESRQKGLGNRFLMSFKLAADSVGKNPTSNRVFKDGIRVTSLRDFPYSVYYVIEMQEILILAVIHAKRSNMSIDEQLNR